MEVEILSQEIIKPSSNSQTFPYHLKSIKLSILDQLSPLTYTSLLFFYTLHQKNQDHDFNLIDKLKISLSETLSKYYPLAGIIKDNQIICNGQGALFQEARVNVSMERFLNQPRLFELLSKLVPCRAVLTETSNVQIAVQLNAFGCGGGVALGACFLHKIMDGNTVSSFIKSWSSVTRGGCFDDDDGKIGFFDYDVVSSLFPHRDLSSCSSLSWLSKAEYSPFICRGKNCTRRFVFESDAISDLKEKAKSEGVQNPTCVEVITGFIWKYAIKAARDQRSGSQRPSVLTHAVNLRRRMEPPLPETSIGNIFCSSLAYFDSSNSEIELSELVNLLRKSFEEIDNNYIQKMTGEEGFEAISNSLMKIQDLYSKKPDSYGFTSWRNMGLNEVDFGLGKPSWVSFAGVANSVLKNIVILKEAISGDGIEVWVILDDEEMKLLENNPDFLVFASLDPSIHIA